MEHGYGQPAVRRTPDSPAAHYVEQLAALEQAAAQKGSSFDRLPADAKRAVIEAALRGGEGREPAVPARRAPRGQRPDGVLLPEQRGERPLLPRADWPGEVPAARERHGSSPAAHLRDPGMPTYDSDICIIGSGLSAAMLAEKLAEKRRGLAITVVEAGPALFDVGNRARYRQRSLDYDESAWPGDVIEDQMAEGIICHTMAVGGQALRWGGACNRFSREDLRLKSLYGLAVDWPLAVGRAGEGVLRGRAASLHRGRAEPLPRGRAVGAVPAAARADELQHAGAAEVGREERLQVGRAPGQPERDADAGRARRLLRLRHVRAGVPDGRPLFARLHVQAPARRQADRAARQDADPQARPPRHAGRPSWRPRAPTRIAPAKSREYRARLFVLAAGYAWSPHLLLLSACSRFPQGLANSSGLVGRYMNGHKFFNAQATIDTLFYGGLCGADSLLSREYLRCPTDQPFVRHDLRVWESVVGRRPRLRDEKGQYLFGDQLMDDWRARAKGGTVRLRAYYDTHPSIDSRLTLNPGAQEPVTAIRCRRSSITSTRRRLRATRASRSTSVARSSASSGRTTARSCRPASAATSIIPAEDAGWAPTRPPPSATATGERTITRTCSSWARRRRPRPDASTGR